MTRGRARKVETREGIDIRIRSRGELLNGRWRIRWEEGGD